MALININPTSSNGTTPVSLVAAVASQRVYPTTIVIDNGSATKRELILLDGTTERIRIPVPADGGAIYQPNQLDFRTTAGAALQFKLSDAGVADVIVSGQAVQF